MNIKPTPAQVREWRKQADLMAAPHNPTYITMIAELAAAWGANQAQQTTHEQIYETIVKWDEGGGKRSRRELARRIESLTQPSAPEPEPVAWMVEDRDRRHFIFRTAKPEIIVGETLTPLFTAAQWGASQAYADTKVREAMAQQATPEGFVRVPLVMTRAMEEVTQEEDWQWADLLAAAEAVTEEQYDMAQSQQTTAELPKAALSRRKDREYFDQWIYEDGPNDPMFWENYYTAAQMHDHFAAGVRAGMTQSADAKLREAVEALLSNEEHAVSGGMRSYQVGSQTWEIWEAVRQAMQGGQQ